MMENSKVAKEIEFLKEKIKYYNDKYYNENISEISDEEFDKLNLSLQNLIENNPEFAIEENELLGAEPSKKFSKQRHLKKMYSLQNAFNHQDLLDFDERIKRFFGDFKLKIEYCCEYKIDGLSFSALYKNGDLKLGLTRGDGEFGEDITENLLQISDLPKKINFKGIIEIRGEIYLSHQDFIRINNELSELGDKTFSNPRNAASGSLRQLDATITKSRNLKYFAYSFGRICNQSKRSFAKIVRFRI